MKKSIVKYLRCPDKKSSLILRIEKEKNGEIIEGLLTSEEGKRYPVLGGIPRFVGKIDKSKVKTQASFTEKWKRIPSFGYDKKTEQYYHHWYLERYGYKTEKKFKEFLSDKRFILDAGTGLGRDTKWFGKLSKGEIFGIEISEAINIAYKKIGNLPHLHLVQADLTKLPFPEKFFDFVSCDWVIHHTPHPEESFKHLVKHLKSKGIINLYVYKKKGPIREYADDYLRFFTTKMTPEECYKFSETITLLGKSLSDLKIEFKVPEDIPLLGIKKGKQNLQRFFYWNILKCFWNDQFDYKTNVMTNFDWYHPKDAHRYHPEKIKKWFKDEGLIIDHFNVIESGISCCGRKK